MTHDDRLDRVALITGAGSGIGRAAARRLHAEGTHVVLTGRRTEPLQVLRDELGERAEVVAFDATDPQAVTAALTRLPPTIDVLVNNAGANTDFARAEPRDLAEVAAAWRANLDSNLLSAVLVTTAVRDRLRSGGSVINIGSIAADKGAGSYGAAKAGLASWTVDLARQLGPVGVAVTTLSPGYVSETEFFGDLLDDDRRRSLIAAAMTGRASTPRDIADAVAFLASAGARQITGQVLAVNGGEHVSR